MSEVSKFSANIEALKEKRRKLVERRNKFLKQCLNLGKEKDKVDEIEDKLGELERMLDALGKPGKKGAKASYKRVENLFDEVESDLTVLAEKAPSAPDRQ